MKRILSVAGVAVLALALVAGAQAYSFQTNLTVGSTGADVVQLQTVLMSMGFDIPAISSGAAAKGYFGSQTTAAVKQYQAAHGIPNTGFVGPMTREALNSGATTGTTGTTGMTGGSSVSTCGAGMTSVSYQGTSYCLPPVLAILVQQQLGGAVTTPTTPAQGTISTVGVPGTLTTSLWSSPGNGTVVYKGQSYDIVAAKLQASASDMAVQSISFDFSDRLWLYASTITLKDDTGAVIGQVNNLNASNFTELTVGTDYRITIPVSNYVVKATQTRYVTANLTFLPSSDRTTGTVGVSQIQVRAVDGTGVTDTETVNTTTSGITTTTDRNSTTVIRTFSYQGTGAGSVVVTVDSASPLAGLVQISTGGATNDVPLAVYDIKSQSAPGNLQSVSFVVNTTGTKTPEQLFSQYNLKIGSQTVPATTITANYSSGTSASSTVTFSNFGNISLPADTYVSMTLLANVQADTNNALDGTIASTTLSVAGTNPNVIDQSYTNLSVNTGTFISSNLTFSGSSANLSNLTATPGTAITCASGSTSVNCGVNMTFGFTLTAGNSTLYLSANPSVALSTSTSGLSPAASATSSLPIGGVTANPGQLSGDSSVTSNSGYWVVPAGSSRQFTYVGSMTGNAGGNTLRTFSITAVNYGTTTSATGGTINYNLQPLKVSSTF